MNKVLLKRRIRQAATKAPHRESIKRIALFGSQAYGKPNKTSDVDLLIEFVPRSRISLFDMVSLQDYFGSAIKKKVDLHTPAGLSKYFRKDVVQKSESIYERQ